MCMYINVCVCMCRMTSANITHILNMAHNFLLHPWAECRFEAAVPPTSSTASELPLHTKIGEWACGTLATTTSQEEVIKGNNFKILSVVYFRFGIMPPVQDRIVVLSSFYWRQRSMDVGMEKQDYRYLDLVHWCVLCWFWIKQRTTSPSLPMPVCWLAHVLACQFVCLVFDWFWLPWFYVFHHSPTFQGTVLDGWWWRRQSRWRCCRC